MLFEFTPLNEFGPFYSTEQTCLNATIYDTAFWFTKSTTFVEGDLMIPLKAGVQPRLKYTCMNI